MLWIHECICVTCAQPAGFLCTNASAHSNAAHKLVYFWQPLPQIDVLQHKHCVCITTEKQSVVPGVVTVREKHCFNKASKLFASKARKKQFKRGSINPFPLYWVRRQHYFPGRRVAKSSHCYFQGQRRPSNACWGGAVIVDVQVLVSGVNLPALCQACWSLCCSGCKAQRPEWKLLVFQSFIFNFRLLM